MRILIVLLLAGCTQMDERKAEYQCRDQGGLHHLTILKAAVCQTGKRVDNQTVRDTVIPVEALKQ